MNSEPTDGAAVPAGAAFVAAAGGEVYYWVGSRGWQKISPLERVWFPTEQAARSGGYRRSAEGFERLEEFEILGEIGRGGTSIVYRARDRALGRDVAIKVIQAHFGADEGTVARFGQEARLLAGLRHPNIVSAFSILKLRGGGLALVMEYVPGRTLRDIISKDGPLSVEMAEQVVRDICDALIAAHEHGIVHRDVKPDNVFLEETTGRAMLADFGIAVHLDNPSGLTIAGTAVGTPNYMSPEQIDGERIDARSDLYSVGLIAWEMLSGKKPWDNESLYSVIYKQKREHLPPLRWFRTDVPAGFAFAIEGALAKDPNARWKDVEEFVSHLSEGSLRTRWRAEAAALLWRRRTSARVAAAGTQLENVARESLQTVFFRRPTGVEPTAAGMAVAAPVKPARRWRLPAAAISVVAVALTALALGLGEPIAAPEGRVASAVATRSGFEQGATSVGGSIGSLPPTETVDPASVEGSLEDEPGTVLTIPEFGALEASPQSTNATDVESLAATPKTIAPESPAGPQPLSLPVARSLSRIAAGGTHSCEIDGSAAILCWGGNDRGQLGSDGQGRVPVPIPVSAATGFQAVFAGGFHSCALSDVGTALCWGENRDGQLGSGPGNATAPVSVASPRFFSLSLGITHTCGVARDGFAYCWGSNANGQVGDGTRSNRAAPTRVRFNEPLADVATGWNHSCALTRQGRAHCWGQNAFGQLGNGSNSDAPTPVVAGGSLYFRSLTAGSSHTCGVAGDGLTYCWGQNSDGRLGDGTTTDRSTPTQVVTNQRFLEISSGGRHTCGLTSSGTAYCWGQNNYGQLGVGGTAAQTVPTAVQTPVRFATIRSSGAHTCAATVDRVTYCWGYNIEGQIGDGTQTHRTTPTRVSRSGSTPA